MGNKNMSFAPKVVKVFSNTGLVIYKNINYNVIKNFLLFSTILNLYQLSHEIVSLIELGKFHII